VRGGPWPAAATAGRWSSGWPASAVDGRATEAALVAVAAALGLRRRQIALVSEVTSRTKVAEVPDDPVLAERLAELLSR
jgi:uncharacterized protein YggU (UPF0235/DUF167 family)